MGSSRGDFQWVIETLAESSVDTSRYAKGMGLPVKVPLSHHC